MVINISLNPYFIGLSTLIMSLKVLWGTRILVSILILLDYLFLWNMINLLRWIRRPSQSLFYWITYSYKAWIIKLDRRYRCLNPYFIGLPILMSWEDWVDTRSSWWSQSLFYWITYSYSLWDRLDNLGPGSLNPYFIGLPILIFS